MSKMIRMNWHDYKNQQFKYGDKTYKFYKKYWVGNPTVLNVFFILNINRGHFVFMEDIIGFTYADVPPKYWPNNQGGVIRTLICSMRKTLPKELRIIHNDLRGYKLTAPNKEKN